MTLVDAVFTRADYMQLPEGFPAQLIEGCLVREPAPTFRHQSLKGRLHLQLHAVVGDRRVCMAPLDVILDELNVFQPDLVVFPEALPLDTEEVPVPVLAVEILSPSTADRDRGVKARRLLAAGVREVWLVDAGEGTIEIRTTDGGDLHRDDRPARSRAVSGLEIVPTELFAG